jgi:hypothetical protein
MNQEFISLDIQFLYQNSIYEVHIETKKMFICITYVESGYARKVEDVGFEVFTAVVLKSIFFWDMTPCSP